MNNKNISRNIKSNVWKYVMLSPLVIYLGFIIYGGVIQGVLGSLGFIPSLGLSDFKIDYYLEVLNSKAFIDSFLFTLKFSLLSSLISVSLGILIAVKLKSINLKKKNSDKNKSKDYIEFILKIPVIIPHVITAFYTVLMFSDSGIIGRLFNYFSLGKFQGITGNREGIGIIIAYIWKSTPYVILTTYSFLKGISGDLERVSENLGASKIRTFFTITIPSLKNEIISSFIILFSFAFGSYEIPAILGPTYPKAMSLIAHEKYMEPLLNSRPISMVYNMIQIVSLILISGSILHLSLRNNAKGKVD